MITTAHHIRSNLQMFCIVLLYTAVSAERGVYEITDTDEIIAGLYVETEDPSTFQQLGGPDDEGYFLYLYSRPNNPTKWMLGDGKNKKRITNPYSAQAHMQKMHEPPQDGWTSTKTGRTQRFKVSRRSSLLSTLEDTEAKGGSFTLDGGAVCKDQSSNKWFILTAGKGSEKCKDGKDCQEDVSQFCLRKENDRLVAPRRFEKAKAEEKESESDVEVEEGSTVTQQQKTTMRENNNTTVMEKLQTTMIYNKNVTMTEKLSATMTENNNIAMTEKQENFNTESTLIHNGR